MAQWLSAWLETEGLRVWASPASLLCVLEQDINPCTQEDQSWHTWIFFYTNIHRSSTSFWGRVPIKWASVRENLYSVVCKQQRPRPACTSEQSDQRLCYSLIRKYIKTCYERNFNFLARLCSWWDWFEARFFGNPDDRSSRDEAQII